MAVILFKGFFNSQRDGTLVTAADVRLKLVMASFTGETEEDSVNVADFADLDEFDGVGYTELDCANVTVTFDDATDRMILDFDDGTFGDPVAAGTGSIYGIFAYLWVDGTDANDIALGFTDQGGFPATPANNAVNLTVAATGFMYSEQA